MTNDEAKKELKSYSILEKSIKQRIEWISQNKQSRQEIGAIKITEEKIKSIVNDGMAERVAIGLDIEKEWEEEINEKKGFQEKIKNKINKIEQPYQDILINIYILKKTIEETCNIMNYSISHLHRLKDKAIEEYSKI